MQGPGIVSDSSVFSWLHGDLKDDLEPVSFPSKHKVCLNFFEMTV